MVLATSVNNSNDVNSFAYCDALATRLSKVKDLPAPCQKFEAVVEKLASKEKDASDPFAGMWAGKAAGARSARKQGTEYHAQVQRRLTTQGRRFSKLDK